MRPVVVAVAVALLVSACWPSDDAEPAPVMSVIPTAAPEGADLVCGMDRSSVEAVAGLAVGRSEGELHVADGVGSGECSAWPQEESLVTGALLTVWMYASSSTEGLQERARLLGQDDLPAPDLTFTTVDGGIWGDVEADPTSMTLGARSVVFFDGTVVHLLLSRGAVGRDPAAGHLALTQQVAATYGLAGSGSGS